MYTQYIHTVIHINAYAWTMQHLDDTKQWVSATFEQVRKTDSIDGKVDKPVIRI